MSRSVALRAWQAEALRRFADRRPANFMTVACPGAGKTTFALAAVRQRLAGENLPIVVVVPTQHLKAQWAASALRLSSQHATVGASSSSERPARSAGSGASSVFASSTPCTAARRSDNGRSLREARRSAVPWSSAARAGTAPNARISETAVTATTRRVLRR